MTTPAPQILHVTAELAGETILTLLRAWQPGQSWGSVRHLLSRRHVQINGNLCLDEGRRLKEGEVVRLLPFPAAPPPTEEDVKIRYLDQHLVVVEKPAGMTTLRHPEERDWPRSRKQLQPTLDEVLPRIIDRRERGGRRGPPGQPNPKKPPQSKGPLRRLRAVHRLDRETSGLMVFARTIDAERELGLQFRAHSLARVYLAVVAGNLPHEETYESHLIEDRGDGRRGSTPNPKLGKEAVTHVKPIERLGKYTVVECRLETGRTHQIRIHLSEAGHPLCGDKVYRGKFPGALIPDDSGAPRVALHAAELGFEHPITGEYIHHEMPLPRDLVELIDRMRGGRKGAPPRPTTSSRRPSSPRSREVEPEDEEEMEVEDRPRSPSGGRDPHAGQGPRRGNRPPTGRQRMDEDAAETDEAQDRPVRARKRPGGNLTGGNFSGGKFSGGKVPGRKAPGGKFSRGKFAGGESFPAKPFRGPSFEDQPSEDETGGEERFGGDRAGAGGPGKKRPGRKGPGGQRPGQYRPSQQRPGRDERRGDRPGRAGGESGEPGVQGPGSGGPRRPRPGGTGGGGRRPAGPGGRKRPGGDSGRPPKSGPGGKQQRRRPRPPRD